MRSAERQAWARKYGAEGDAATKLPKFRNRKVEHWGIKFDSVGEAARYRELLLMIHAGVISGIELKPRFDLVVNGLTICQYEADFSYFDREKRQRVVEDFKSEPTMTRTYRIKKKLMKALHGIDIVEVMK